MGSGRNPTASAVRVRERGNAVGAFDGDGPSSSQASEEDSLVLPLVDVVEAVWRTLSEGAALTVVSAAHGGLSVETRGDALGQVPAPYVEAVLERRLMRGAVERAGQYPQELLVRLRRAP